MKCEQANQPHNWPCGYTNQIIHSPSTEDLSEIIERKIDIMYHWWKYELVSSISEAQSLFP